MHEYFNKACFWVPCQPETAQRVLNAYNAIADCEGEIENLKESALADDIVAMLGYSQLFEDALHVPGDLEVHPDAKGLCIHGNLANAMFNEENAANIARWCLKQDHSDAVVNFIFLSGNNHNLPNDYHSGAVIVTRHEIIYKDLYQIMTKEAGSAKDRIQQIDAELEAKQLTEQLNIQDESNDVSLNINF